MSAPPKKLSPEELEELERRTNALLNRRGVRYENAISYWRRSSLFFETGYLMLVSNDSSVEVRVGDDPDVNGMVVYAEAYTKKKATNVSTHHYVTAKIALQLMRDLMVLDDLSDV